AAVFGMCIGCEYMIFPLMTAEIFGVQLLGRLLGVILTREAWRKQCRRGSLVACATRQEVIPQAFSCWSPWVCWARRLRGCCPEESNPHEREADPASWSSEGRSAISGARAIAAIEYSLRQRNCVRR